MNRALTLLFCTAAPLVAQPPRAEPVNEALVNDPGSAFFQRIKNLFDQAANTGDVEHRIVLFQRAAELFETYLNDHRNHANAEAAWYYLGEAYIQSGQPELGRTRFHTLLNRFPNGTWAALAAYKIAYDHYTKREYNFAAPLFERYAKTAKPSDRHRGSFNAGNCYRLIGRDREALASFKEVIDDPAGRALHAHSKFYTSQILLKQDKAAEALPLAEEVINNTQNPAELRGEAALVASSAAAALENHELAKKYLQFILITPGLDAFRAEAQTALMKQAFDRKDYREVVALFQRGGVKAEGEKEAVRLLYVARSYMALNQPTEALQLFREAETLVPQSELAFLAAYYRLRCFFQIEGKHVPEQVDAFLQLYRKTRPPDDPQIHTALLLKAETLFSANDMPGAAKAFNEINSAALSSGNLPGYLYKRGWCLAETGDLQGAIRSLSDFITKYPEDDRVTSALARRAQCHADSGDSTSAIADFDKLTAEGMPAEVATAAWLSSARMRRTEDDVKDMIVRYKALLGQPNLNDSLIAEANFRIGWGLVKQNAFSDAIPFLEKARSLDSKSYGKNIGLLLCMAYGALQDSQKLSAEINLAIDGGYADDIPDQTIQWTGMEAFNAGDYKTAARFLNLIANAEDPRTTPIHVWRYLGKAQLESGDAKNALTAANNVLETENDPRWKADTLVDKGRALLAIDRSSEARIAADEADKLRPAGRTLSLLQILSGDLFAKDNKLDQAGASYIQVVEFGGEPDLKALAYHKLAINWEKRGNPAEVEKFRALLAKEFPDWKAP